MLLFAFILAPAAAQIKVERDGETKEISISAISIPADLKKDAKSVVRHLSENWEMINDHQAKISVHRIVTLLGAGHGGENRQVSYYDQDSKITKFKATLYDAMGNKIRDAKKSEIEDIRAYEGFDGDTRVQTTVLDHPSYPYTIEFEYEQKVNDFTMVAGLPQFQPMSFDQSVEYASFKAMVPNDNKIQYFTNDLPEPKVNDAGTATEYVWAVESLPARKEESESPAITRTMPYMRLSVDHFTMDGYEGSMRDWNAFGKFIGRLTRDRDRLPAELKQLVRQRTAGLTSTPEKIDALYRLMQERTRYVSVQLGIGGWQPFSAEYVEKNKYGDCKALSNYMGAMLKEVGIPSYPVLVHWSDDPSFPVEEDFTVSAFNHMILYVPEEEMYLECTSSDAPTGYLGDGKYARNVLWITPEGGKLVKTPTPTAADNGRIRTLKVEVSEDGSAKLALRNQFHGTSQEDYRSLVNYERDRTKQLERLQAWKVIPDVTGAEYSLQVAVDEPVAELKYVTEVDNYARKMGSRLFVPINKYDSYDFIPEKLEQRRTPLYNDFARFYVDTIQLSFPADLEIESLGEEEVNISHAAGDYRSSVTVANNQLTWVRTLKILPIDLPAEEYDDYRKFFIDVAAADGRKVVLKDRRTK